MRTRLKDCRGKRQDADSAVGVELVGGVLPNRRQEVQVLLNVAQVGVLALDRGVEEFQGLVAAANGNMADHRTEGHAQGAAARADPR